MDLKYSNWGYSCANLLVNEALLNSNKNSLRTLKKAQLFAITEISWLTLVGEIIPVYAENHTEPMTKMHSY
jgi:hypothetical protein